MKLAITLVLVLSACYDKSDAVKTLVDKGRPSPIVCSRTAGGGDTNQAFTCTDGAGIVWACDVDDCIKIGTLPAEAR